MVIFGNTGKNARLIGTALLVITFIAGGLAGAAFIHVVSAEKAPSEKRAPAPMRSGPRRLLLDEQFQKELALTTEQRTRIRDILDRRDAEARKFWQGIEPRLREFGQQVHDEIEQVLTADQQKQLDAAIEQRRATFRKRHECPPTDSVKAADKAADQAADKETSG